MKSSSTRIIDLTVGDLELLIGRKIQESLPAYLAKLPAQEKENEFLEIGSAADLLHMARSTVYTKCSKGILPYIKRGRKLLFERERLLQFMQAGRQETLDETEDKINKAILGKKKNIHQTTKSHYEK